MLLVRALRVFLCCGLFGLVSVAQLSAQANRVRLLEGRGRGFLVVRDSSGAVIGRGEIVQYCHGPRVTSRILYNFRDGSVDDETTVYTQDRVFKVISDHHIQKGPFFPKAIDITLEGDGNVKSHTWAQDGKESVETSHVDLPPDLANGIVGTILANAGPKLPEFTLSELAATGKGRLVKLKVSQAGHNSFQLAGARHTASLYRIHMDLGGVAGKVAPVVGKQPEDIMVWMLEGDAPAVVRGVLQLSEGGPLVSIEVAGASFPREAK